MVNVVDLTVKILKPEFDISDAYLCPCVGILGVIVRNEKGKIDLHHMDMIGNKFKPHECVENFSLEEIRYANLGQRAQFMV